METTYIILFFTACRPEKRKSSQRRDALEEEKRIMKEIHRRVVEHKDYTIPGLTLAILSGKLGVSSAQVSRAVNRITGRNFCRWLNEIRIKEAVVRLSSPARICNISEVAYSVGFGDRTTFFRAFKQLTGSSPREFCRSMEKIRCNS